MFSDMNAAVAGHRTQQTNSNCVSMYMQLTVTILH
jgi:hypothetical protein